MQLNQIPTMHIKHFIFSNFFISYQDKKEKRKLEIKIIFLKTEKNGA